MTVRRVRGEVITMTVEVDVGSREAMRDGMGWGRRGCQGDVIPRLVRDDKGSRGMCPHD